jgi:hypothetical protein
MTGLPGATITASLFSMGDHDEIGPGELLNIQEILFQ